MQYMSVKEAAAQWGVTIQMVRRYCQKGMVPQVVQENGGWRIPVGTPRPGTQKPEVVETKQSSLVTQITYQCRRSPASFFHRHGAGALKQKTGAAVTKLLLLLLTKSESERR